MEAMRNCILRDMYYVPLERIPNPDLLKRELSVTPLWFGGDEPRPKPIKQWFITEDEYMAVPVYFGLQRFPDPNLVTDTSAGQPLIAPKRPDPFHEKASEGQDVFMKALIDHFAENSVGLAKAATGTGKTVSALNLAAERGRSTLVIVDREYLGFNQWIPEAKLHLGLTDDQIGIVQGDRCEYQKPFCVGIAASIYQRVYPPEFYDAFGTVIIDEIHKYGAREMSRIIGMFSAECRLAQSATIKRKDGTTKLITDYFGDPTIVATAKALRAELKIVEYCDRSGGRMPNSHGARMSALAFDEKRNQVIVREIVEMYNEGRNVLVIGDDIRHLQRLEVMCWKQGIAENKTGQFSRDRYIFTKEPGIHKGEKVLIKRMKKVRVTNEYLDWCKAHARVIFATYGMMKEGIDIPRLDGGIDATPRKEAEQVVGRIRRPHPNKKKPRWVTIKDTAHFSLMRYFEERLADYLKTNVEVLND
jgi:superfamily II DNA or RNA helicase